MEKKIIYPVVPQQVLSDNFASVFADEIAKNDQGGLQLGAQCTIPFDPISGKFQCRASVQEILSLFKPTTGVYEAQRTMTWTVVSNPSAGGNSAVFTPTAGKKFRLLGFDVHIAKNTTTAAGSTIFFRDGAATEFLRIVRLDTAVSGDLHWSVRLPGNGYLSTAADNVLNVTLTSAITAGNMDMTVYGTEE